MVGKKCNEYKSYTSTKKVNEIYLSVLKAAFWIGVNSVSLNIPVTGYLQRVIKIML